MVDLISSFDGYAAAEGWPGLWGMGGPDYLAWLEEEADQGHTTLMGARTYRLFADFVASGADGFDQLTAAPKVVFSQTLDEPLAWSGTRLVREDALAVVRRWKADGDVALRTIGSLSLCRSLLRAGLVDLFRVVVFPVVTGASGEEPIYRGWPDVALAPVRTRTFDQGLQLFDFRPRVLSGPPGAPSGPTAAPV